jgi:tetratricopeptide (TPR) repeat protein
MSIQVSVRVRPIIPRIDGKRGEVVQYDEEDSTVQLVSDVPNPGQLKAYRFDHLIGPEQTTGQLYDELVRSGVQRLHHGYNLALFAYGPSGAGKTHTMTGDARSPGITSLAFRQIFAQHAPDDRTTVRVSVMEIYQDVVYDLLNKRTKVQLKGTGTGGVLRFQGLQEQSVHSADEAVRTVESGLAARTKAKTYVHEHSNRSHTVVRVLLETSRESTAGSELLVASLLLVDLAGSETVSDQQTQIAQSEGKSITRSLFHLRRCIHALAAGRRPEYRSSKLTRLLEPAIGQGSISIICNVGQRVLNQRQTVDCLDFGKQAAMVKLAPPKQNVAKATGASDVQEIRALKKQLNASRSTQAALEAEIRALRCEYSVREANRQREIEEQLLHLQHKLRQEMTEKAEANELLRAAEEQNQNLHSQLLDLEESLSRSQIESPSVTPIVSDPWSWVDSPSPESRPLDTDSHNQGTQGLVTNAERVRTSSGTEPEVNTSSPSAVKPQHATVYAQTYPASPAGPDDARKVFGDAQSAEQMGETREALELYQSGLRMLMKHVQQVPSDHSALQPHVQAFFDKAFGARERLKQQPVAPGPAVSALTPSSKSGGAAVNDNKGGATTNSSSFFADALVVQADAAEESGEYKLALALLQEAIRMTLAFLKEHPDQQAELNSMLESLFQRAYAVRKLVAGASGRRSPSPQRLSLATNSVRTVDTDDNGAMSFSSDIFSEKGSRWHLCRAAYTFRATSPGDLSVVAGDLIAVDGNASGSCVAGRRVTTEPGSGEVLQLSQLRGVLPTKYVEMALYRVCCVSHFQSEEKDEVDLRQG